MDNKFFNSDAEKVAKQLLGKTIVRKLGDKELRARIVETEAYYDENDPASRARQNGNLSKVMHDKPGTILVYGVHNNWLLNFVTGNEGEAQAVLIRAIEPLNFNSNGSGPGLLTKILKIDKSLHEEEIGSEIWLEDSKKNFDIISSNRIGVKEDLDKELRFYIENSEFVSKL